jgi:hypothetical protein
VIWLVLIDGLLAFGVGWLGRNRKFGFWGCFLCSLIFSPIAGLIVVLASEPRRREPSLRETALEELQSISATVRRAKQCGSCGTEMEILQQRLDSVERLLRCCK